jgi:hypothetical protein
LECQTHRDAHHKVITEFGHGQKWDTVRRSAPASLSLGIALPQDSCSSAWPLKGEPGGQTGHGPLPRPLRQYTSVYRI